MKPLKFPVSLLLACGLAACSVGPRYQPPQPDMPADFASSKGVKRASALESGWWRKLGDPGLNRLVTRALEQNKDAAAARARLLEARALWREARLDFVPTVTSGASHAHTRTGPSPFGSDFGGLEYDLYRAGFDADWELDFFGRVRHSVRAAKATSEALQADLDDLLVSLSAEVAVQYLELRGAQAQLAVARENAENQAGSLKIAETSLEGGRGTKLDVARASAQWNATQAQIPVYEEAVARAIHRLAVLTGQSPSDLRGSLSAAKAQPAVPSGLALAKPADLLRRRPDIRAVERQVAAETERVGVAVADLFPRVTFNGQINLETFSLTHASSRGAEAFSFGPRLSWAAFNLGRVRRQIEAAGHRADAALARYEQTVLLALEEAENALTAYERERVRLRHLEDSAAAAREAATLARQRYQDGIADFLAVLDAERVALGAQNDVVVSRTRAAAAWVAVYKAFGGGWNGA